MDNSYFAVRDLVLEAIENIIKNNEAVIVASKGHQDIVTQKDILMERAIISGLKTLFPKDCFIGEEEHDTKMTNARTWVIDPIDGTVNFAKGLPLYGVQLALLENQKPLFCLIILPEINQIYMAQKGHGATLNGQPIVLDQTSGLKDVIVTFGDFSKSNPSSRPFQVKAMTTLMSKALKVRIQGASSVDFAFAASGKNGGHIMFSKRIWEIAPGLMFAEEAGCAIQMISGDFDGQGIVIAQNDTLLKEILTCLEV